MDTICRARGKGLYPQFFIRQAVGTHDGGCGELPCQLLHVLDCGKLQVHNGHVCTVPRDGKSQLIDSTHHVHSPEMVVKRLRQRLTRFAVALCDNYAERFHRTHPLGVEAFPPDSRILQGILQQGLDEFIFSLTP
jgi:hypothetical protein